MTDTFKEILRILETHESNFPNHAEHCLNLKSKYTEALHLVSNNEDISDFIEWNKLFAPRIIFDGIGNKELLKAIEKLNEEL